MRAQPDNWLPFHLTLEKLLSEQMRKDFCHEVLMRQPLTKDLKFFEDPSDDLLMRKPSHFPGKFQIVFPASLRPRLLVVAHSIRLTDYLRQNKIYYTVFTIYNQPLVIVDRAAVVRNCHC